MLIRALCDYYDILSESGKVLKDGYSKVSVSYLICLTPDGNIDEIIDWQKTTQETIGNKLKEKRVPREIILPKRTEKPGIDANIVEHRPVYIFGLNYDKGRLTPDDRTNKAKKSHEAFVETTIRFIEGINSPVINAFRNFVTSWQPCNETENSFLIALEKKYPSSGFAFCLSGDIERPLHNDKALLQKWIDKYENTTTTDKNVLCQCGVSGKTEPIARIHSKIKGIFGGSATGNVLIGFNNPSDTSYGKEQSYNSNISESVMKKYTESLNYLLSGKKHKTLLDDITVVYWANSKKDSYSDFASSAIFGITDGMNAETTEFMLNKLVEKARNGEITYDNIMKNDIDENVEFYIMGIKPNVSRLSLKFFHAKKFGTFLQNIAMHQCDMQISKKIQAVPLWRIKKELLIPESKNDTVDPSLLAKILEAIMNGTRYPDYLLSTIVRRVRTDSKNKLNETRAGIIKACINRDSRLSNKKEEIKLSLDKENNNQAYLCGRLFAVLEKLQQDASGNSLNRTIKDAYFSSASITPGIIFPKLLKLAQNHLTKVSYPVFYNKLSGEIIDKLFGQFPDTLSLNEQGKFIIGYYQQYQSFFATKEENK